jgi:hypothetical protein
VGASPIGPSVGGDGRTIHSIAFYIELIAKQLLELDVRLIDKQEQEPVFERSFQLPIDVDEDLVDWEAHTVMVLGFRDMKIDAAGEYFLQVRQPNGDWHNIRTVLFPEEENDELAEQT